MKVKSIIFNWHQVGSLQSIDGAGPDYDKFEVGKQGVTLIEEYAPKDGISWNYLVHVSNGIKHRVFNVCSVEYFPQEELSGGLSEGLYEKLEGFSREDIERIKIHDMKFELKFRAFDGDIVHQKDLNLSDAEMMQRFSVIDQSTGLFDSNGVEIFENDIVNWLDASGQNEYMKLVFKSTRGFILLDIKGCFGYIETYAFADRNRVTVVGNAHQLK